MIARVGWLWCWQYDALHDTRNLLIGYSYARFPAGRSWLIYLLAGVVTVQVGVTRE